MHYRSCLAVDDDAQHHLPCEPCGDTFIRFRILVAESQKRMGLEHAVRNAWSLMFIADVVKWNRVKFDHVCMVFHVVHQFLWSDPTVLLSAAFVGADAQAKATCIRIRLSNNSNAACRTRATCLCEDSCCSAIPSYRAPKPARLALHTKHSMPRDREGGHVNHSLYIG